MTIQLNFQTVPPTARHAHAQALVQTLAVTGRPLLGRADTELPGLVRPDGPIFTLGRLGPDGPPLALAVWTSDGPAVRFTSARLLAVTVSQGLPDDVALTTATALISAVLYQYEFAVRELPAPGYVVADVPDDAPVGAAFAAAGWERLQPPGKARTSRYVAFAASPRQDPSNDVEEGVPTEKR